MPSPRSGFADFGLPVSFLPPLTAAGIDTPTPIQSAVIADALAGRDVCGRAPTGSGKTLAFGLPLAARLESASNRRPTALVLAPTRELADQIATAVRPFVKARNHAVVTVYGGVGYGAQRKGLAAGAELVVACPGRLEDLIATGDVSLENVRQVVIDEADRMADMGFLPAVRRIVAGVAAHRQVHLFSATLDGAVAKLVAEVQTNPVRHEVGPERPDVTAVRHAVWRVERPDRVDVAAAAIEAMGSTIVFCRTRHGADRLVKQLGRSGVTAAPIHGGRSQPQRDRALQSFARGDVSALVATDVAARGVHVDDVGGVLHFDLPADGATFIHRSGRTARAGANGIVVTFVEQGTEREATTILRAAGVSARPTPVDVAALTTPAPTPAPEPAPLLSVAPASSPGTDRRHGTLKTYNGARGFGFIAGPDGADVFVHRTHLPAGRRIRPGQPVTFGVQAGRRGPEAVDVRVLHDVDR